MKSAFYILLLWNMFSFAVLNAQRCKNSSISNSCCSFINSWVKPDCSGEPSHSCMECIEAWEPDFSTECPSEGANAKTLIAGEITCTGSGTSSGGDNDSADEGSDDGNCSAGVQPEWVSNPTSDYTWSGKFSIHDPTKIVATDDGYLVVFGSGQRTCGRRGLQTIYVKPGETTWREGGQMFGSCQDANVWPSWLSLNGDTQDLDAPGVLYSSTPKYADKNGVLRKWAVYYSYYLDHLDSSERAVACMGRATLSGSPENFTWIDDEKPVYCSNCIYNENTGKCTARYSTEEKYMNAIHDGFGIDPALFEDNVNNKLYMSWGSGILNLVELDTATGHLIQAAQPYKKSSTDPNYYAISYGSNETVNDPWWFNEAPFIYEYNGVHYLFANVGGCCAGTCSTYQIMVGRSTNGVTGPYKDKEGYSMGDKTTYNSSSFLGSEVILSGGSFVLGDEGRIIGPGHVGILDYTSKSGQHQRVMTFHYYDRDQNGAAKLGAKVLTFDSQGWPVVGRNWDINNFGSAYNDNNSNPRDPDNGGSNGGSNQNDNESEDNDENEDNEDLDQNDNNDHGRCTNMAYEQICGPRCRCNRVTGGSSGTVRVADEATCAKDALTNQAEFFNYRPANGGFGWCNYSSSADCEEDDRVQNTGVSWGIYEVWCEDGGNEDNTETDSTYTDSSEPTDEEPTETNPTEEDPTETEPTDDEDPTQTNPTIDADDSDDEDSTQTIPTTNSDDEDPTETNPTDDDEENDDEDQTETNSTDDDEDANNQVDDAVNDDDSAGSSCDSMIRELEMLKADRDHWIQRYNILTEDYLRAEKVEVLPYRHQEI